MKTPVAARAQLFCGTRPIVGSLSIVFPAALASTVVSGDPSTPAGLLAALRDAQLTTGHATYFVRLMTPAAKVVQRLRGVRRVPGPPGRPEGTG